MRKLALDIETIPNIDVEAFAEFVEVSAPSNYKDADKIANYIAEKRQTIVADLVKEASLSPLYGRVACVCTEDVGIGEKIAFYSQEEKEMLEILADYLSKDEFQLYSYYGKSFDVPFLDMRFRYNGIQTPFRESHLKKYDTYSHMDLCDMVKNYGSIKGTHLRYDLKTVSEFLGYQAKTDIDGSDVFLLWQAGKYDDIINYCHDDVDRTVYIARTLGYYKEV